jgi:ribosomal protein L3
MNWYADRGILLEEEMARIHLENARLLRPDINVGELNLIARAKIAYVAKCKQGKGFTPYLMASVLNCLKGKEFDGYRKRWNEIQEEKKREQEENDRLKLYLEAHASEL